MTCQDIWFSSQRTQADHIWQGIWADTGPDGVGTNILKAAVKLGMMQSWEASSKQEEDPEEDLDDYRCRTRMKYLHSKHMQGTWEANNKKQLLCDENWSAWRRPAGHQVTVSSQCNTSHGKGQHLLQCRRKRPFPKQNHHLLSHHLRPRCTSSGTQCTNLSIHVQDWWTEVGAGAEKVSSDGQENEELLLQEKLEISWLVQHSHWKAERGWGCCLCIHRHNKHQGGKRGLAAIDAGIKSKELWESRK